MSSWVLNALETLYGGLVILAPHTQIKTDDAVVSLIEAIKSDAALFGHVTSSLDRIDNSPATRDFGGQAHERKADVSEFARPVFPKETIELLQSRGFEIDDYLQLLPAIIQFIQLFRKKRKD